MAESNEGERFSEVPAPLLRHEVDQRCAAIGRRERGRPLIDRLRHALRS